MKWKLALVMLLSIGALGVDAAPAAAQQCYSCDDDFSTYEHSMCVPWFYGFQSYPGDVHCGYGYTLCPLHHLICFGTEEDSDGIDMATVEAWATKVADAHGAALRQAVLELGVPASLNRETNSLQVESCLPGRIAALVWLDEEQMRTLEEVTQ